MHSPDASNSPNSPPSSFHDGSGQIRSPKAGSRGFLPRFSQFNKSQTSWTKPEAPANAKLSPLNQNPLPPGTAKRGRNSYSSISNSFVIDSLQLQSELQKEKMIRIVKDPFDISSSAYYRMNSQRAKHHPKHHRVLVASQDKINVKIVEHDVIEE